MLLLIASLPKIPVRESQRSSKKERHHLRGGRMEQSYLEAAFSLKGNTSVVTGCSSGIGFSIAKGLALAGSKIIGLDIAEHHEIKSTIEEFGGTYVGYHVDLSDREAVVRCWEEILAEHESVDLLVNNAGVQYRRAAAEFPLKEMDRVFEVNLKTPYVLSQLAVRHYLDQDKKGKIINLASLFSTFGGFDVSAYTCTKHGMVGLTRAFSNEYASRGITVNAIAPGYVETKITKVIKDDPAKNGPIVQRIPIARWAQGDDFIGVAIFLASRLSDYITGAVIPVDGGYTAR